MANGYFCTLSPSLPREGHIQLPMSNEEYILHHRLDDVRALALKKGPEGVDMVWCLQQIEGWQLAQKKLPRWAAADGTLWFPPRLSMEQCSSESTALYKQQLVDRLLTVGKRRRLIDLTGGFGIDFSYLAPLFREAVYVERQEHLCEIARHNLPMLGLSHAKVMQADSTDVCCDADLVFMDPARRDTAGRKTVAIEDCTPNVVEMQEKLLARARYLIIKLSPMLDITQALKALRGVEEVHVVSVKGECKELLLVMTVEMQQDGDSGPRFYCANLETEDCTLECSRQERQAPPVISQMKMEELEGYLFEPNASILKAGCQDMLCEHFGLEKLHPCSNLFLGMKPIEGFPGRQFSIDMASDFSKKGLKDTLSGVSQGNLTTRNFPTSVAELRKKFKLREGGDLYFFATTLSDGTHVLIRGKRITAKNKIIK